MTHGDFTDTGSWGGRPVAHKISEAASRGRLVVTGVICAERVVAVSGSRSYECTLDDGTGRITLVFLGRRGIPGFMPGTRCTVEGTARLEGGRLTVWNPRYRIEAAGQ